MKGKSASATTMYTSLRNLDYEIGKLLYMRRDSDIAAYLGCAVDRVTKVRARRDRTTRAPEVSVLKKEPAIGFSSSELDANKKIRRASQRLGAAIEAVYATPRPARS